MRKDSMAKADTDTFIKGGKIFSSRGGGGGKVSKIFKACV